MRRHSWGPPPALVLPIAIALGSCNNPFVVDVPQWPNGGYLGGTKPLDTAEKLSLEGVYAVDQGKDQFGDSVVLKWTGKDTSYLGVFAGMNVAYLVLQAGVTLQTGAVDSSIYVEGYWRYQNSDATGLAQAWTPIDTGGTGQNIHFVGAVGDGNALPTRTVSLHYVRPIKPALLATPFYIVSHHGSGGAPELLPASENTVEIAKLVERYGANGIEVDVRPTKDGIPILYHDTGLNTRLTQKGPLVGPVEDYSYAQIEQFVRLVRGEKIPTLAAFLDTVITSTALQFVYVDMKPTTLDYLPAIVAVQQAAITKAAGAGRNVQIYLAITSDDILARFVQLPNYQTIPTICELGIDQLEQANSHVWSPRFTQQIPVSDIDRLHTEGRLAITWTVNIPDYMKQFIDQGKLDGVLSDYTSLAAFYYYSQ